MEQRYILIVAVLLVMGWFAASVIYNLRRGGAVLRWMQGGLPRIGERTKVRWLGSSVAELVIERARPPFRRLETLVVLAPRDIPWIWLWAVSRGRRDTLIFRGDLATQPAVDLEWADPAFWTGRAALQQAARLGWTGQQYRARQLMAPAGALDQACAAVDALLGPLELLAPRCWRLSLRRQAPHLEVHLPLPDRGRTEPAQFFEALRALARAAEGHPKASLPGRDSS